MFTLTLTETTDTTAELPPLPEGQYRTASVFPQKFEHFSYNFRELPAAKIQQIIALITKPPRAPRSDKGRRKQKGDATPTLPGAGT